MPPIALAIEDGPGAKGKFLHRRGGPAFMQDAGLPLLFFAWRGLHER